jgi:hypothetical protein
LYGTERNNVSIDLPLVYLVDRRRSNPAPARSRSIDAGSGVIVIVNSGSAFSTGPSKTSFGAMWSLPSII